MKKFNDNANNKSIQLILLADDDADDCMFFQHVIDELSVPAKIITVHNGECAMQWLATTKTLPDIIFLDINMPCKNGTECLKEIKEIELLQNIPVIVLSTSLENDIIQSLYKNGALFYIRKPSLFTHLKLLLSHVINLVEVGKNSQTTFDKFILRAETNAI